MLTLKPFKDSDAAFFAELLKNEQTYALICGGKYGAYPASAQDIINYYAALSNAHPMTAYLENRAVGHILIVKKGENALLGSVVIDSAERGRGLGKEMLKAAVSYAFEKLGAKEASIGVFEENHGALALYKALGFKEDKKEKRPFLREERTYIWLKLKGENYEHL
ncbi:MAG: GNAT family N-acetyltransferase [Oscillospiraceae bacterium]|nr:GNAT family N-acetyltransferase [Oscillospiraceae bacterium]